MTSFPDSVDVFKTFLNIEARDGTAIKGYTDAMQAGDQVLANQYLAQISSASQKIIQAMVKNNESFSHIKIGWARLSAYIMI